MSDQCVSFPHPSSVQAWENHLRRNRSVVVDLFAGNLRSEVLCQSCGKSSVRFDPFTFLQLPIPVEEFRLGFIYGTLLSSVRRWFVLHLVTDVLIPVQL